MKPYAEFGTTRVFCGDAGEVMASLQERFDLLLTDPPYGIGDDFGSSQYHAKRYKTWALVSGE